MRTSIGQFVVACLILGLSNLRIMADYPLFRPLSPNNTEIKTAVKAELHREAEHAVIAINQPSKIVTLNDELDSAIKDLQTIPQYERDFYKYLTTYNIPDTHKIAFYHTLNFWIHSISAHSIIRPPKLVDGTTTLYRIDIRDYKWTEEAWEKVAVKEPYVREPWVDHQKYNYLRLESGNALVRADWFIVHTADVTKQVDNNEKDILYYTLLYSASGIPKTLQEFRDRWGVDNKKIEALEVDKGTIINEGESGISRHNRQITRARTELGYYFETSDVKTSTNKRDYIENLSPGGLSRGDRDAGEAFSTNKLGLQVYFLFDKAENRVEFGDPTVVFDKTDAKDARVRTARSCVICHSTGINAASNALQDLIKRGVNLRTYEKDYQLNVERFFLSNLPDLMTEDAQLYARSVKSINGLAPEENTKNFKDVLDYYEQNLNIETAALECGVSVEEFKTKIKQTISGRLGALVQGKQISRVNWENPYGGTFAQAMLLLHNLPAPAEKVVDNSKNEGIIYRAVTIKSAEHMAGKETLAIIPKGTILSISKQIDGWNETRYNSRLGYVYKDDLQIIKD